MPHPALGIRPTAAAGPFPPIGVARESMEAALRGARTSGFVIAPPPKCHRYTYLLRTDRQWHYVDAYAWGEANGFLHFNDRDGELLLLLSRDDVAAIRISPRPDQAP